ncbi:MAG: hypothetical protein HOP19_26560, partial [Acidobacteria bacterium]|nr:hypothetical protein [Acidobacteriota bacterium]
MKSLISLSFLIIGVFTLPALWTVRGQNATGTLSGSVKDPNGAVVTGAQVAIRNDATNETRNLPTDNRGNFKSEKLPVGDYTVTVTKDGFKPNESKAKVESGREAKLEIKLEIAETRAEVSVAARGAIKPNSDTNYRALRDAAPVESFTVNNLTLKRDVGTLTLRSGTVSFYAPVLNRVAVAVFTGEGEFTLTPAMYLEADYLKTMTGKETLAEPFTRVALCFTDETYQEVKQQAQTTSADARAADLLKDWHRRLRYRTERPRSLMEALLKTEDVENIEAMILCDLYNPKHPGFFSAFIYGQKRNDLRFHVRPRGAFPQILSPEEVALLNVDWDGKEEGVLYLAHFESEYKNATASSEESHYTIDAQHYQIETAIRGEKLTATATLTFKATAEGERVVAFGLLPELRVARVTIPDKDDPNGREPNWGEIDFIQESRKEDGSFFAIWPEALVKGNSYKITIEYQGDKVLEDAGGGTFAVGARTSWYPSVNSFNDRATFDLTFKVPKKYVLIGVGNLVSESVDNDLAVTHWVSEVPLAVA